MSKQTKEQTMSDNFREVTAEYMGNVCYHNTQGGPSKLKFYFRNRPPSVFINNVHCRGTLMQDSSGTYLEIICPSGAHWRYTMDDVSDVFAIHQEEHRTQSQSGDNLEVAKECGAMKDGDTIGFYTLADFESYTYRILAEQQAAHDAEIARLKEEVEELMNERDAARESATYWMDRHRDEEQTAGELRKDLEPLQAQVAILKSAAGKYRSMQKRRVPDLELMRDYADELDRAVSSTQATAEQFIAECEQRGSVKALEDVGKKWQQLHVFPDAAHILIEAAAELRTTSKKAG